MTAQGGTNHGKEFLTTHWSVVNAAGANSPEGVAALSQLCGLYWYPLYAFARKQGYDPHDAEDLTQAFFARLLEREIVKSADPARGRFRSFLVKSLDNFLSNERRREHAIKRGGGSRFVSIDLAAAEERYRNDADDALPPEKLFDRRWAMILLEQALQLVREHYRGAGNEAIFDAFKPLLTSGSLDGTSKYSEACARLNMTADAGRAAVYRLRKRYRRAIREIISETVESPDQIEDEIRDLFRALSP